MALAEFANGTQTCVIGTTHTLSTPTAGKTYVLMLDLNALAAGDVLNVILQAKALTGGTMRNVYTLVLAGPQADPVFMSVPIPAPIGTQFQILQSAGTGRAVPWSVVSLD
jgi:hypothetical protein